MDTRLQFTAVVTLCGLDAVTAEAVRVSAERVVREALSRHMCAVAGRWPGQETFDLTVGSHKEDG